MHSLNGVANHQVIAVILIKTMTTTCFNCSSIVKDYVLTHFTFPKGFNCPKGGIKVTMLNPTVIKRTFAKDCVITVSTAKGLKITGKTFKAILPCNVVRTTHNYGWVDDECGGDVVKSCNFAVTPL